MIAVGTYFDIQLFYGDVGGLTDFSNYEENDVPWYRDIQNKVFNFLDELPVVKYFTPLLKMLTFYYPDDVPYYISIFLWVISVLTLLVINGVVRN